MAPPGPPAASEGHCFISPGPTGSRRPILTQYSGAEPDYTRRPRPFGTVARVVEVDGGTSVALGLFGVYFVHQDIRVYVRTHKIERSGWETRVFTASVA